MIGFVIVGVLGVGVVLSGLSFYPEKNDSLTVYVFCDYNPDEVKSFYEIPDALADLIQPDGTKLTFAECLALLIDPKENE